MKYRNFDKSTMNSAIIGGLVVDRAEDSILLRFENLSKPRLGWYYNQAMIGKPKENDSLIGVTMPNGVEPPLVGSLVAVYGVLVTDHESKAQILAEYVEDVTNKHKREATA